MALARYTLVHDDLVASRPVPVLPKLRFKTRYDDFLVCLPQKAERSPVVAFRSWLLDDGRAFMAAREARSG